MSEPAVEIAPGIAALPPPAERGLGQVVLQLDQHTAAPTEQIRDLYKLSDPALSELGFDSLLDELLVRVRELLAVDTAAILLLDHELECLVARAAKGIEEEVERGVRIPIGRGFAGRIGSLVDQLSWMAPNARASSSLSTEDSGRVPVLKTSPALNAS